jgi:hypothetical protein
MKPFLGSLALSVLVHALLVWLISIGLFRPVISVLPSLESIAIELASPEPEPEPEPNLPQPEPEPPAAQTPVLPMGAAEQELQPEPSPEPDLSEVQPVDALADATEASDAAPVEAAGQGPVGAGPRLPVSGVLAVQAYLGRYALDGDPLGRGELWVEFPSPDRYRLRLWAKAEGWAAFFVREPVVFESKGRIDDQGLRPELYRQQTPFRGVSESRFDAESGTAVLEQGQAPLELPQDFQDRLSIIFQLSWLSQRNPDSLRYGGTTEVKIAGRRRFVEASFRAELPEDIVLPGGIVVTAVRLVSERLQSNREGQIEIWLDAADQNLPVRILFSEPSGRALDFLVIRDVFNKPTIEDPDAFKPQ